MTDAASHASSRSAAPGTLVHRVTVFPFVLFMRAYQLLVRPFLVGQCKFHPTCSEYAVEALQTHGLFRGIRLAATRLLRCHPFGPGGIDPVPPPDIQPPTDTHR